MAISASSDAKGMLCLSMMRRFAGFTILASAFCLIACPDGLADTTGQASGQGLPNVLMIMADDPAEQNDLSQKRRDVFGPMSAALRRHIQQGGAVPWQKPAEDYTVW